MYRIVYISILFCLPFFAIGQIDKDQKDLKIGLVLSGGGAKGMAHIGALKVIEEAGIQIDYIGGSSMGAIIGSLYASGYSATQLDSIFRNTNLSELIQDNLPRNAKTFYEKEDAERYILSLPFNNFKIGFPSAISSGQNIYGELVRLLYHVKDVNDFKKLPIPFLCIATDIETGQEVLLDKGYLPEAVMASGTLPSFFEPSELDGRVLIDGGVTNNYPIDEVKNMGADIIIGIDVQDELSKRESLASATALLLQINNFRTVKDMVIKSKQTDIYLRPDITDFSVIDFGLADQIISRGETVARENFEALKKLGLQQTIKAKLPMHYKNKDSIIVNDLILMGNTNYTRGYIKGKLRFKLGSKITFEKLKKGINNLSATGNFKTIRYRFKSNSTGVGLILNLKEDTDKTFIRLGAHYDDLYKSGALINLTKKNVFMNDDVASFDLILGDNVRYNLEYYVDKGTYWSFGFNSRFNDFEEEVDLDVISSNFEVPVNTNVNRINFDVTDITNQIYIQTVIQEEFSFTLGVEHKFLKYGTRTFNQNEEIGNQLSLPEQDSRTLFENSSYFSAYSQLKFDTYNDTFFPNKGLLFDGDFHYYAFSSDFNDDFRPFAVAKARLGAAFPITSRLSLNIESEGGFKLGTSRVTSFDFILGGFGNDLINNFTPFLGYDFLSLPGNSYVKAFARLDYEFANKNHLFLGTNFANVADDIFRTGEWFTSPDFSGYAIGYGLESFLGPVHALYAWSPERGNGDFFISVGYWF